MRTTGTTAALNAEQMQRHQRLQRAFVTTLGCLWILAFLTGCGRNTKNCSAYDGITLSHATQAEMVAPVQD